MIERSDMSQTSTWTIVLAMLGLWVFSGCVAPTPAKDSAGPLDLAAIQDVKSVDSPIPDLAASTAFLMPESNAPNLATYTITVTETPLTEVLFALARDADLNIDVFPGISGNITLNAVDQTLPVILNRIAEYANLKYRISKDTITIAPDLPFRSNYKLDYIQNKRVVDTDMSVSTRVASTDGKGNSSNINVTNSSQVDFWTDIVENINAILGPEEEKDVQRVVWNRATGVISILASSRQHREVQKFFDQVTRDAQRQVFIEAIIVEIQLSDQFQAGVDWNMFRASGAADAGNNQDLLSGRVSSAPKLSLTLNSTNNPLLTGIMKNADLSATVRMLSQFGNAKVLSTPRVTVINNQTAVLRVTTNQVYFQIEVTPPQYSEGVMVSAAQPETTIRTVPIGFIMHVTPQISDNEVISLNIRPTIQRISEWVDNPDPNLRTNQISGTSFTPPRVPVVQVQEMDSILRVTSGEVAVMGGLMENSFSKDMDSIPVLGTLPVVGQLFSFRNNKQVKKELVIFLRPIVIHDTQDMQKAAGNQDVYVNRDQGIVKDWSELGVGSP